MAHPAEFKIIDTVPGTESPRIMGHDPLDDVEVDAETEKQIEDLWDAINAAG
jgi:hypothetical protein